MVNRLSEKIIKITRSVTVTKKADRTAYNIWYWYSCRTEPLKILGIELP